jgi:hypothetical protein
MDSTQENLSTVHGLMCRSCSRARRGPRLRATRLGREDEAPSLDPEDEEPVDELLAGGRLSLNCGTDPVGESAKTGEVAVPRVGVGPDHPEPWIGVEVNCASL